MADAVRKPEKREPTRRELLEELRRHLKRWTAEDPAAAPDLRAQVCAALEMKDSEYLAWIGKPAETQTGGRGDGATGREKPRALTPESLFPNQPAALGRPPTGEDERGEISNFFKEFPYLPDADILDSINGDPVKIRELAELHRLDRERMEAKRAMKDFMRLKEKNPDLQAPAGMSPAATARLEGLVTAWKCVLSEDAVLVRKSTDQIRAQIRTAMRGWPMRLVSGSLFVDDLRTEGESSPVATAAGVSLGPPVRLVDDATQFLSLIHDYGRVKFNKGQDAEKANYVDSGTMFSNLLSSPDTPNWLEVERFPHEPALPGHYYAWRGTGEDSYEPTGEALAELLGYFDNVVEPWHRALLAAAVATVFWGGKYGTRPFFFLYAQGQGSGKTTFAELVCSLVGGYAHLNFSQRDEERLKERILSDEFSGTRCLLADNVDRRVESPLLAEMATASRISGKKLAVGEAWRPNSLVVFMTGNNPSMVKDLTVRTFFIKFEPIEKMGKDVGQRVDWNGRLSAFLKANSKRVMADCLEILRTPAPVVDWSGLTKERNAPWVVDVLSRVMNNPRVRAQIDRQVVDGGAAAGKCVTPRDVIVRNQAYRDSVDDELDEATRFHLALLERICGWYGFRLSDGLLAAHLPPTDEPVFVRASAPERGEEDDKRDDAKQNIATVWRSTIRGDVNPSWVGRRVNMHIEQDRLPGLKQYRTSTVRGYVMDSEVIVRFLADRGGRDANQVVAEWLSKNENDGHNATTAKGVMTP